MADYYPLLAKAVAGLPDSTPEARHAIYERARKALFGQLRTLDPPIPEEAIEQEAQALEVAVARIETESASRPAAGSGAPPPEPDRPGATPSAPVPATPTPRPLPPLKVRRDPRPLRKNLRARPDSAPESGPAFNPTRPLPPPARDPAPAARPAPEPAAPQDELPAPATGVSLAGQTAPAGRCIDAFSPEAPGLEAPASEALAVEASGPETDNPSPEGFAPPARTRLDAQRPFALPPAPDAGAAKRFWIVGGTVGLVVALIAFAAFMLRDRPEDLVRPQPSSSLIQGEAGAGGKIADRIGEGAVTPGSPQASAGVSSPGAGRGDAAKNGSGPANPPIPVARRAALLVEAPEEQSKVKTFLGTVVWRADNVSNGPDEPLGTAVRAEIDIPEEKLQVAMTIQKNFDATLPASHTVKLLFAMPPDSPLGNIKQISVLQMRREDTPTGEALKGITVPIMENSFLVGLARGAAEASNLDLLRSREWLDVPMVLANGRIAKLTFEKGPSGQRALDDAIASWQTQ